MDRPSNRYRRATTGLLAGLFFVGIGATGCGSDERTSCSADGDCPSGELCYVDDQCLPRGVIQNRGDQIGTDCVVQAGAVFGCPSPGVCRLGFCNQSAAPQPDTLADADAAGHDDDTATATDTDTDADVTDQPTTCTVGVPGNMAPLFGGVTEAWVESAEAVGLRWIEAADETLPEALTYLVFISLVSGAHDFDAPHTTVVGSTTAVLDGLETDADYFVVVRAQDAEGQVECNTRELVVTPRAAPACVDYATDVQGLFDANCTTCHAGEDAPQGLRLTSYDDAMSGSAGGSVITACQPDQSLLWLKVALEAPPVGERMPRGGPYLAEARIALLRQWIADGARENCDEPQPCGDAIAPQFAGLESATLNADEISAQLCWSAAADDTTPTGDIRYDVYQATSPGGQDFGFPSLTSDPGQTCVDATTLVPDTTYCWVVQARDGAGNVGGDPLVERCLTTPTVDCVDYATLIQPLFDANCTGCHAGATAPQGLQLTSFAGLSAGGANGPPVSACQPGNSLLHQKVALDDPPIGARMPFGGPYLDPAEIDLIGQWITEGGRQSCDVATPCDDITAPVFAGLASATLNVDEISAQLCWSAAADDTTPAGDIRYDVYQATSPGGQDFGFPSLTSDPGQTCVDATTLVPDTTYCWVVQARDGAGNVGGDPLVERCLTTPSTDCVDYATLIQPLFDANCIGCHAGATAPQGLQLTSFAGLSAGGTNGPPVSACQPGSSLLHQKVALDDPPIGARMPFGGPYLDPAEIDLIGQWITEGGRQSCDVATPCDDTTAPVFAGLASATLNVDQISAQLCWSAAADDTTPTGDIRYDVYQATSPGGQDFSFPSLTSDPGQTCVDATTLVPDTTYCWVVQARDGAGNVGGDPLVERCLTTPTVDCVDYATLIQPLFDANCTGCHAGATAPQGLQLTSFAGLSAGGASGPPVSACQPDSSLLHQKVALDDPPIGARMPFGGPYLDPAEIDLIGQWITEGARQSCDVATPCDDTTAPVFAGLASATLNVDEISAQLCWSAADDDTTPTGDIRYDVFQATSPGGQDFSFPSLTSDPGQTCVDATTLVPDTTYCWVVLARDGAGNVGGDPLVERCLTTPTVDCVDYATLIQPLFDANCIGCHAGATAPQGLQLTSFAGLSTGGASGPPVSACQPGSSLLHQKVALDDPPIGARMPFGGPYLDPAEIDLIGQWITEGARQSCDVATPCDDTTAPVFAGLASATLNADEISAQLCWSAADDDTTLTGDIRYDVYQATSPGGQDFGFPSLTSDPGQTCVDATTLVPDTTYCWVVLARDGAGNVGGDPLVERCLTTPTVDCVDYATLIQPLFDANCTGCHAGATAPQGLQLTSFAGLSTGGASGPPVSACQPDSSLLHQKVALDDPPIGARMPFGGPYLDPAEIDLIGQWITEGGRQSCDVASPCSDTVPPTFDGLTTASVLDATRVELCWEPAADNATASGAMIYEAYRASSPGLEDLTNPTRVSAPGASCLTATALSPGSSYCWIVRARDGAGNLDANTIELCRTLPTLPAGCVDYPTMVQPLFNTHCTRCHSGQSPPQWLRLSSYDDVIAGSARGDLLDACDGSGSLLLDKVGPSPNVGRRMPYDGPPYLSAAQQGLLQQWIGTGARRSCAEAATCADAAAPTFDGAANATAVDATTVRVCWAPASDAQAPAQSIRYAVYESLGSGAQSFSEPPQRQVTGATCVDLRTGPQTTLCAVVRAVDLMGNADNNSVEVCATTPAAACALDYAADVRPIFAARCAHCHSGALPPRFLALSSYGGLLAGGTLGRPFDSCDWDGSLLKDKLLGSACGQRMPFDGAPWLAPSEVALLGAWVDSGAREQCSDADPCADNTPPTFAGAVSATQLDATTAQLCWGTAADDSSASGAITFEIYEAGNQGGQLFSRPASYTAVGDATCRDISIAPSAGTCWVVRARDLAGNRDTNTHNVCLQAPGACVEYWDTVQPIFDARCTHCHSGSGAPKGIRLDHYDTVAGDDSAVRACRSDNSNVWEEVADCTMPDDTVNSDLCSVRACLTPSQERIIQRWIDQGADESCPSLGCNN